MANLDLLAINSKRCARFRPFLKVQATGPRTPGAIETAFWIATAWIVRLPLLLRVESAFDHDQAIVGIMALDIAEGRRFPIFFDGQRYMGALESYTAAPLVWLFGNGPVTVAAATVFYFSLFVAWQFRLWTSWADRRVGRLAAALTLICPPMLTLWSVVPRGGYTEILFWSLPTLATYRALTRPNAPSPGLAAQVGWGFWLAVGYFINPLALIVYITLAIDWVFGRHGADMRAENRLDGSRWDGAIGTILRMLAIPAAVLVLGFACHVTPANRRSDAVFVFLGGLGPESLRVPMGIALIVTVCGLFAWKTGFANRAAGLVGKHPGFGLGMILAAVPMMIYNLRVALGLAARDNSLPIWIRAPWNLSRNIEDGLLAIGPLIGVDARASGHSWMGVFVRSVPPVSLPTLTEFLLAISPIAAAVVVIMLIRVDRENREEWRDFHLLKGTKPGSPTLLATIGVSVTFAMYLLQATSPDSSSIRYLLPVWIFLPGLLAVGLTRLPRRVSAITTAGLLGIWSLGQFNLWHDLRAPLPERALTRALERRGVTGIVAASAVAHSVTALSSARVGGIEYHPIWMRLGTRYHDRVRKEGPLTFVTEIERVGEHDPRQDLGIRVAEIARKAPDSVRLIERVGNYAVWEVNASLESALSEDGPLLSDAIDSATVLKPLFDRRSAERSLEKDGFPRRK